MISEKLYTCTILNRNNVLLKIPPMVYDHLFVFVYLSCLPLRPFPTIKMINIGDSFILNKKLLKTLK